jgi:hypothetical protein
MPVVGELPSACASRADVVCQASPVQPFDGRSDLFAGRRAQEHVSDIEALRCDHPARDLVCA